MRLVCARPHYHPSEGTLACESVGAWLLHSLLSHAHELRLFWLRERLIRIGFIDNECEGGLLFWRWDYKHARLARRLREIERLQWESKREAAIRRWGEGAG